MRASQNNDYINPKKSKPVRDIWMRPNGEVPKDLIINQLAAKGKKTCMYVYFNLKVM